MATPRWKMVHAMLSISPLHLPLPLPLPLPQRQHIKPFLMARVVSATISNMQALPLPARSSLCAIVARSSMKTASLLT